jgi:hypothetical protein
MAVMYARFRWRTTELFERKLPKDGLVCQIWNDAWMCDVLGQRYSYAFCRTGQFKLKGGRGDLCRYRKAYRPHTNYRYYAECVIKESHVACVRTA